MSSDGAKPEPQIAKTIKRLRNDPIYQQIEVKAKKNPENVRLYAGEAIKHFKLDSGWQLLLQHVLINPDFIPRGMTGASIQPYKDPVSEEKRYFIPVSPETTQKNVLSSYRLIQARYKGDGQNKRIRKDDPLKTDLELFAYRRSTVGAKNKEIQQEIKDQFGEELELFQIKELINAGKNKKVG